MFEVKGSFRMGQRWQPFTKQLDVKSEDDAREKIFSVFGGNHGVPRRGIKIDSIKKA